MRDHLEIRLLAILLSSALAACGGGPAPPPEPTRPVKTFVFGVADEHAHHTYPGRVHANRAVEISFQVAGQLVEFPVNKGQQVQEGDLIARLDQRDFQNAVKAARAVWQEAVATRDRYRVAAEAKAVSQQELDERVAQARVAAADLRIKLKALEDSEIRADFDGTIATTYVDNFQHVEGQQPVVSLQDVSTLEIHVDIPQADMSTDVTPHNVGQLSGRFDIAPEDSFELHIKEFVTEADPVTQTFPITLALPNPPDLEIFPGMTASVEWIPPALSGKRRQLVPATALDGSGDGSPSVWVIDPQSSETSQRHVRVGRVVERDMIELLDGLQPGETIASAGISHLRAGMKVHSLDGAPALPSVAAGPPSQ